MSCCPVLAFAVKTGLVKGKLEIFNILPKILVTVLLKKKIKKIFAVNPHLVTAFLIIQQFITGWLRQQESKSINHPDSFLVCSHLYFTMLQWHLEVLYALPAPQNQLLLLHLWLFTNILMPFAQRLFSSVTPRPVVGEWLVFVFHLPSSSYSTMKPILLFSNVSSGCEKCRYFQIYVPERLLSLFEHCNAFQQSTVRH